MASSSDGSGVSRPMCRAASWSAVVPARTSEPSVCFGCTPFSHVELARECSPLPSPRGSACPWARPLTTVSCLRYGSRGCRMRDSAKPGPVSAGVHSCITAPLGM